MIELLAPSAVVVPLLVFWVWMFTHMMRNRRLSQDTRRSWIFAFIFINVFGAALYYFNEVRGRK